MLGELSVNFKSAPSELAVSSNSSLGGIYTIVQLIGQKVQEVTHPFLNCIAHSTYRALDVGQYIIPILFLQGHLGRDTIEPRSWHVTWLLEVDKDLLQGHVTSVINYHMLLKIRWYHKNTRTCGHGYSALSAHWQCQYTLCLQWWTLFRVASCSQFRCTVLTPVRKTVTPALRQNGTANNTSNTWCIIFKWDSFNIKPHSF